MRIRYLLLNAYGRGGTIRTTLSMAGALAERGRDVEVASLLRTRARPSFAVDPRVRIVTLTGSRPRRSSLGLMCFARTDSGPSPAFASDC